MSSKRISVFQSISDAFHPAHRELLQETTPGQAGIQFIKADDLHPRENALIAFQEEKNSNPNVDPNILVDTMAMPWGKSLDRPAFYMAYKAEKQLDILDDWLTLPGEENEKMHIPLKRNVQADKMKVVALGFEREDMNPRSAIFIQSTPLISPYSGQIVPTHSMEPKNAPPEDKKYPARLPEGI